MALEGRAARVTTTLQQRLAVSPEGQGTDLPDGGFTHEFSAPSAGPPPWYVYEFMPEDAYAVATEEPGGATRWTF